MRRILVVLGLCAVVVGMAACVRRRAPAMADDRVAADVWLAEGARSAERGDLVRAEQYLLEAAASGVPLERLLPLLLRVCVRSGRQRRALAHVRTALRENPDDPHLWALAGTFAWAVGELDEAEHLLETAAAMPSAPADVHFWQARVAISGGDDEAGGQHLERYLEASPGGPFSRWARMWIKREKGV